MKHLINEDNSKIAIDLIIEIINNLESDLSELENTKDKRSLSLHLDLVDELFNDVRNNIKKL